MTMPERNAKVRRRLAAGKLHLRICDLRNLGPRSEDILATVGIRTAKELRERGALETYLALRRAGHSQSLNLLWALVGALEPWPEGRDWREVARSPARLPLMLEVEARDSARESTLQAAGVLPGRRTQGRKSRASLRRTQPAGEGTWVPGLPFEGSPKKKNRPSGRSSGATPRGARGR
jgi:DNA transformation protein